MPGCRCYPNGYSAKGAPGYCVCWERKPKDLLAGGNLEKTIQGQYLIATGKWQPTPRPKPKKPKDKRDG